MKKLAIAISAATLATSSFAADFKTDDQKIAYAIGTQIGGTLKGNVNGPIELDENFVFEGITDVLKDNKIQLSDEEMNNVMQGFAKKAQEFAKKKSEEAVAKNQAEAEKLLAENKKKDGVKVTDSGLQYRVITEGEGKKPTAEDTVKVHYKGTFADGTTFDSSYDRGQPINFPLKGVIKGWTEGLQLMPVGSKYEFVIPAELAYGAQGPGNIGPNRALVFEVELLDIKPQEEKKPAAKAEAPKKEEAKKEEKKS